MSDIRLRPRFEIITPVEPNDVLRRLQQLVDYRPPEHETDSTGTPTGRGDPGSNVSGSGDPGNYVSGSGDPGNYVSGSADAGHVVTGRVFATSAVLKIPADQVHFWSPQLEISVDPHLPGGSVVRGLFGPRPAIWSLFIALYVGIAFAGGMGVIYGYAQWTLGAAGHALWSGPAALVAFLLVYLVGRQGRHLGMKQMHELRSALDAALA